MARNDGIDHSLARNRDLSTKDIQHTQLHNERENKTYSNPDIVPEESCHNIHFKKPSASYQAIFDQLVQDGVISTGGLKEDATHFGELLFDVNSAYFHNHGGYEFAKQFYADAYKAAVDIVGGEQYIVSAVMHADERNRAMSEALGQDVFHYHLHVVYIPVVEKQILWSKRCKDKSLVGTVKETIMQVSRSKKWASKPAVDENGQPVLKRNGKPKLVPSYSVLQDEFFHAMQAAGYTDLQRGQRGSTEEHLTVTQFKVRQEKEHLAQLEANAATMESQITQLQAQQETAQAKTKQAIDRMKELAPAVKNMEKLAREFADNPDHILPEPGPIESAKSYREKKAKPILAKIVKVLRSVYSAYLDLSLKFERLQGSYVRMCERAAWQEERFEQLKAENNSLRETCRDFERIKRIFGKDAVDHAILTAKQQETAQQGFLKKKRSLNYSR